MCNTNCTCPDPSCFPAGTMVLMADGSGRAIEDVKEGDIVLSYDPTSRKFSENRVKEVESPVRSGVYILNGGLVKVTNEHPFYIRRTDTLTSVEGWASIDPESTDREVSIPYLMELSVGDLLMSSDGTWLSIVTMEYVEGEVQTYNLILEDCPNTYFANGLLVHNKDDGVSCFCKCYCYGPGWRYPNPVTPSRPRPSGVVLPSAPATLEWSRPLMDVWGTDGMYCANGKNKCACTYDFDDTFEHNRKYELYLSNVPPSDMNALPNQHQDCPATNSNFICAVTPGALSGSYTIPSGTLKPGVTYYWAVRAVDGAASPYVVKDGIGCPSRGPWSSVWTFTYGSPDQVPAIVNVEVLKDNLHCWDVPPSSGFEGIPSRWTGSAVANPPDTINNPLDIAVTVYDGDGWRDFDTIYFMMVPEVNGVIDSKYTLPFNCYDELKKYLAFSFWPEFYFHYNEDFRYAIALEALTCSPNCTYKNETDCEARVGCSWDESWATALDPYGCAGCRRDWAERPFSPTPSSRLYQYDQSCNYKDGTPTGCNGCYFKTTNYTYTIEDVRHEVLSDTTVKYIFRIKFSSNFPIGTFRMLAMAKAYSNGGIVYSAGENPGCDETLPCRTTSKDWTWGFDFTKPFASVNMETDIPNNSVTISEDSSDPLSGLKRVFNHTYDIQYADETPDVTNAFYTVPDEFVVSWNSPRVTDHDRVHENAIHLQGGEHVTARLTAEDRACNVNSDARSLEIGQEWMLTLGGDVYSGDTLYDPLPPLSDDQLTKPSIEPFSMYPQLTNPLYGKNHSISLSQYWIGADDSGACSPLHFLNGSSSAGTATGNTNPWCSNSYQSKVKPGRPESLVSSWYDELYRLANHSDWLADDPLRSIVELDSLSKLQYVVATEGEGIYQYTGGEDIVLAAGCPGRKLIFLSGGSYSVTISPKSTADPSWACLFVGGAGVTVNINPGAPNDGMAEEVNMAFILEGDFIVYEDLDPLLINGFVFASGRVHLARNLGLLGNDRNPSEIIRFDPAYLEIFRDMLGRRKLKDFECGISSGSSLCTGW